MPVRKYIKATSIIFKRHFVKLHNMSEQPKPIAIYWHPDCSLHDIKSHPERPLRVDETLRLLRTEFPSDDFIESPLVTEDQIKLFHSAKHLQLFQSKVDKVARLQSMGSMATAPIDADTVVMPHTKDAAYRAAGSVIAAIDDIFNKKYRSAFCCVRPPGHHAETNKICGFCFFNNAGIGARYAQQTYGVKKVAILDFDVHHGNGTEENFINDDNCFYGSTHEIDNFPNTGEDPTPYIGDKVKLPLHRRIVNRYLHPLSEYKEELSVRHEFYMKWKEILDEMVLFSPELVIISAGFDAHDDDPLAWCDLRERDYTWVTQAILQACIKINPTSPPPCISVLEGGYDITALSESVLAHVHALAIGYPILEEPHFSTTDNDDNNNSVEEKEEKEEEVEEESTMNHDIGLYTSDAPVAVTVTVPVEKEKREVTNVDEVNKLLEDLDITNKNDTNNTLQVHTTSNDNNNNNVNNNNNGS